MKNFVLVVLFALCAFARAEDSVSMPAQDSVTASRETVAPAPTAPLTDATPPADQVRVELPKKRLGFGSILMLGIISFGAVAASTANSNTPAQTLRDIAISVGADAVAKQ